MNEEYINLASLVDDMASRSYDPQRITQRSSAPHSVFFGTFSLTS